MLLAGPSFSALIVALNSLALESFLSFSHVCTSHLGTEEGKIWPRQTVSRPVLHLSRAGVVPGPRPRAAHKHGLCRNLAKVSSVRTGKRAHCRSPVSECTGCTVRSCSPFKTMLGPPRTDVYLFSASHNVPLPLGQAFLAVPRRSTSAGNEIDVCHAYPF